MLGRLKERFPNLRKAAFVAAGAFALIWVTFFDSHSLLSRLKWHREKAALETENAALRTEIDRISAQLAMPLTDDEIERIAREEYGMSKPGETVYPVQSD